MNPYGVRDDPDRFRDHPYGFQTVFSVNTANM